MTVITDEQCTEYAASGHPERPARITASLELLRRQKELEITWAAPVPASEEAVLRAHERPHFRRVQTTENDFDGDTPYYPEIFDHALRSAGGALEAMQCARRGETAFSLLRPPGHHATPGRAMGFCYFNSIAIAVLEAVTLGARRVAVYDFDVHHGNGTESILKRHSETAFFSVHQHPCYPGTGSHHVGENCFNFPVAPGLPRADYRTVLQKALRQLEEAKPDLIGVSAGFDAYARDPLAEGTLEVEDYQWLGQSIHRLDIPVFAVLEGGYSEDLPELILAFLNGLAGR